MVSIQNQSLTQTHTHTYTYDQSHSLQLSFGTTTVHEIIETVIAQSQKKITHFDGCLVNRSQIIGLKKLWTHFFLAQHFHEQNVRCFLK